MAVKSNFFSSRLSKMVIIVAVFGLLVFFNPRQIFDPVQKVLQIAVYPFQKFFYQISSATVSVKDFLGSIGNLKKENGNLFEQNQKLSAKNALLSSVSEENRNLREQLNLVPKEKFELEGAFVISRDPHGLGNWIEIDKGKSQGIASGMPVIVSDGILVGKVGEVSENTAQIILISNPQSLINAMDLQTGARGIVQGEYQLGSVLNMVLPGDALNHGDDVVSSGSGGSLPKGLLIGKVEKVSSSGDGLFQQAVISLPIKFSRLEVVFVVKK
jgi:rod shape-determining protein MreC